MYMFKMKKLWKNTGMVSSLGMLSVLTSCADAPAPPSIAPTPAPVVVPQATVANQAPVKGSKQTAPVAKKASSAVKSAPQKATEPAKPQPKKVETPRTESEIQTQRVLSVEAEVS